MEKAKKNTASKKVIQPNQANFSEKNASEEEKFQYSMDDVIKAQIIAEKAVKDSINNLN